MCHVYAYLVCSAGQRAQSDKRMFAVTGCPHNAVIRYRRRAVIAHDAHKYALVGACYGRVHSAARGGGNALGYRHIGLANSAALHFLVKARGGKAVLGKQDDAARVSVKPVGRAKNKRLAAHGGAVCKGVCKRIVKMTVRGMRRHSRRFIRNYDVVILKEDRQGELFRNNFGGPGLGFVGKVERKPLAGGKTMAHGHTHAVHRNAGRGIFKESQRAGGNVHPPAQKIENGQTVKLGSNVNVHISTATYYNK